MNETGFFRLSSMEPPTMIGIYSIVQLDNGDGALLAVAVADNRGDCFNFEDYT